MCLCVYMSMCLCIYVCLCVSLLHQGVRDVAPLQGVIIDPISLVHCAGCDVSDLDRVDVPPVVAPVPHIDALQCAQILVPGGLEGEVVLGSSLEVVPPPLVQPSVHSRPLGAHQVRPDLGVGACKPDVRRRGGHFPAAASSILLV